MPDREFGLVTGLVRDRARSAPDSIAFIQGGRSLSYAALDALADRVAAALQRDGVPAGEAVAICAATSIEYAAAWFGILRAGAVVAPLPPSSTAESLAQMTADCGARLLLLDAGTAALLAPVRDRMRARIVALDGSDAGERLEAWLAAEGTAPEPVEIAPDAPFNIIYSSGTTGSPKGIVQPHSMRWRHVQRGVNIGYGPGSVTLVSTPLYSNTTLVSFIATVALGGTCVLMAKFDAGEFLRLAQAHRATHAMLVPVQYQRLMDRPDFDRYDLTGFVTRSCTSAPFSAALKAQVLARWPGALVEYYGMTEGGGTCVLHAHLHPDKLHTVGRPAPGHDIRLVGEDGREVAPGGIGEVVGRSDAMMLGYHNRPDLTAAAWWQDADGRRYMRTGDIGGFDEDGFLVLMDRRKDMIISGGFNIYPSDIEAVLAAHPAVRDAAVVGVPSRRWGETPVAFVAVRDPGIDPAALREWTNARLGRTQRLADVVALGELPRNAIGKILKRELRDAYRGDAP
ncbi:MAG: class I adenylate-forming enzyme family protein [Gammaproteobacteria bacterium]